MSNIRYEDVPDLSIQPIVTYTAPAPVVEQTAPAPTVSQTIPQPGTPLVDTAPDTFIAAPAIVPLAPTSPTVGNTAIPGAPTIAADDGSGTVSRQGEPIPQPGTPLVDTAPGVFIPAPDVTAADTAKTDQTVAGAPEGDLPDLEGLDFFGNPALSGAAFVQYVRRGCDARNLDDLAVFANAMAEGLSGGMGDNGTSFGPWNMHQGGKLPVKYSSYPAFSPLVQTWAWTGSGIDWALNLMAREGIGGLHGHAAVHAIVERFEIPANIAGQEVVRDDYYDQLARMGDPYSFLAARAAGPNVTIPSSSGTAGATPKSPVGAVGFWRTLMDVFWKEIPKTHERVLAQGENMRGVFK